MCTDSREAKLSVLCRIVKLLVSTTYYTYFHLCQNSKNSESATYMYLHVAGKSMSDSLCGVPVPDPAVISAVPAVPAVPATCPFSFSLGIYF